MVQNMETSNLYKITPKSRELVAQSGNWGLYETVFTIEKAFHEQIGESYITIHPQALLPDSSQNEYISLKSAQKLSGLSKEQLIELCSHKTILAKTENGELVILLKSLKDNLGY